MTDLLNREEYVAIASNIDFPRTAFIGGKFRAGRGKLMPSINQATGETICEVSACNAEDVNLAVSKAREAFDQGHWALQHPAERKEVLTRPCKLIIRNRRELAALESLNSGKPIRDCELIDIPETIHTLNYYGEGDISTSFGGYKQTGFGGRDNGIHAHDQYTKLKTIWVDLSDSASGDKVE